MTPSFRSSSTCLSSKLRMFDSTSVVWCPKGGGENRALLSMVSNFTAGATYHFMKEYSFIFGSSYCNLRFMCTSYNIYFKICTCLIIPAFSCSISISILLCCTWMSRNTSDNLLTGPYGNFALFLSAFSERHSFLPPKIWSHSKFVFCLRACVIIWKLVLFYWHA